MANKRNAAGDAVLRRDAADGDVQRLPGEEHFGAAQRVLEQTVFRELPFFIRGILRGHLARVDLLRPRGGGGEYVEHREEKSSHRGLLTFAIAGF